MQAHPVTRRRGIPWQLQALAVAGALAAFLSVRVGTQPGRPEGELPLTAAEWADPDRDPVDFDLGTAGSVSIPAGWTPGYIQVRGPRGGGGYTVFEHKASGTALHWDDATASLLPIDFGRIRDPLVAAQAEEIARDLADGE